MPPLQGSGSFPPFTQGVALGFTIAPLRGKSGRPGSGRGAWEREHTVDLTHGRADNHRRLALPREAAATAPAMHLNDQRVIDLTQPITGGMPVYPGDPAVRIEEVARHETDGFAVAGIHLND